jgi:glutamate---cysteine ligase / carboxylate-amine ligase
VIEVATRLTLGAEEELHVIDLATMSLTARAPEILAELAEDSFGAELQQSTVETKTAVCEDLDQLGDELRQLRRQLLEVATGRGLGLAAVGTVPLDGSEELSVTPSRRFTRMHDDYRLLVEEQLICGTQVHVGVADRDLAVAVTQRVAGWLPVLLAVSASSPYWHGVDTGYASIRTMIWQRWPTAGATGPVESAAEYDELVRDLIASGVISDAKMAYFDVRPSSHVPTVELRVCDACPRIDDAVLLAGLFRALITAEVDGVLAGQPPPRQLAPPVHRAAMWRAARSGLEGELLAAELTDRDGRPSAVPASDAMTALLQRVRPQLEELGDWATVAELADACSSRGTSAARQRAAYRRRGRLSDVVALAVAETEGLPAPGSGAPGSRYEGPVSAGEAEELLLHQEVIAHVAGQSPTVLAARLSARDRLAAQLGMSFVIDGRRQPFPIDVVPRIVGADDWRCLVAGLKQRARALEAFLRDAYGRADVLRDGVIPRQAVYGCPGWREAGRRLPRDAVRAPVLGFDVVRDLDGTWRVLEDNARVPSGVGYALAARELLDKVMPDLPRPSRLRDPHTVPELLHRTLQAIAPAHAGDSDGDGDGDGDGPTVALLSDGAGNSAWFEHKLLAQRAGFLLAEPAQLRVHGDRVLVDDQNRLIGVDVLYLRLDVDVEALVGSDGTPTGRQLVDAAAAGRVTLANAPGNGIADDKGTYPYVPALIEYYLGEKPLLEDVRTLRCSDPAQREEVLDRLAELVTKPVDGYGGSGVLLGPHASPEELAARRVEIRTAPARWVAQEMIHLSTQPTLSAGHLEPRHVDLRVFGYLRGLGAGQVQIADLALTRVAPAASMVVNSSRGGGAKDTWLLAD